MATDGAAEMQFDEVSGEEYAPTTWVQFKELGQEFIGVYTGTRRRLGFYGPEVIAGFRDQSGASCSITLSYDLRQKMSKVKVGSLVQITYVDDRDTGQAHPMRIFKVGQTECPPDWESAAPARKDRRRKFT